MERDYTIIIDAGHGGDDFGESLENFTEKDYSLYLSKYLINQFNNTNLIIKTTRDADINLSASNRIDKIKNLITNKDKTIIISIHTHFDVEEINIIYSKNDNTNLSNIIYKNLKDNNIKVNKPTTKKLPVDWDKDYYYIQREINQIPTIIIDCFCDIDNLSKECDNLTHIIKNSILEYLNSDLRYQYIVKKNDTLYQIAKDNNISVNDIKNENNLTNNTLSIGQVLEIPDTQSKAYITYTVKNGDNLYQLARKYNTTVDNIKKLNNLTSNTLSINQVLKIPLSSDDSDNITIPEYETYTVKSGDNLYKIASKYNTTVNDIMKTNNLSTTVLSIGQVLKIQTSTTNLSKVDTCYGDESLYNEVFEYNNYTVEKGDSLWKIANKFNTTVKELISLNNLTDTSLSIGQILKVPIEDNYITYTVKSGDNLYKIANIYNTTANNIMKDNNLDSTLLSIGQVLIIKEGK